MKRVPIIYSTQSNRKKRQNRFFPAVAITVALALILGLALTVLSVFRTADALMRVSPQAFNHVASHLMPSYDSVSFLSLNGKTRLNAWFFKARRERARGNIVLVHNNRDNRLQFGLESADLFRFLTEEGFHIFAFDLRHSGNSDGERSAYGYTEYEDVLAALEQMKRLSGRSDFILFAVGSGVTATLLAWNALPERSEPSESESPSILRGDLRAFIFDTAAASAFDYIRADLNEQGWLNRQLYYRFIPEALRISCGGPEINNLIPLAAQIQAPMMITRNLPDSKISSRSLDSFINERLRLNPETTQIFEEQGSGHLTAFRLNKKQYLENLRLFLDLWFEQKN